MTSCEDVVSVAFPRFRCTDCNLDFRVDLYTHTCGSEVKCKRPAERHKEVCIPKTTDAAPAAQCDGCATIAAKAKVPKRVECPGCGYVGNVQLGENGKCAACNAPKHRRGRAVLEAPAANEIETNTMGTIVTGPSIPGDILLTSCTRAVSSSYAFTRDTAFVRFKFVRECTGRDSLRVVSFTLNDDAARLLLSAEFNADLPVQVSAALKQLQRTHNIKLIPPTSEYDLDIKFMQLYHKYADEDKFPVNLY